MSLPQDFRNFEFLMPWEGAEYVLPGDEKAQPEAPGAPSPLPATGNVAAPAAKCSLPRPPKTTETPAQTGGGAPADKQATREARKPRAAKAASEVSKPARRDPS